MIYFCFDAAGTGPFREILDAKTEVAMKTRSIALGMIVLTALADSVSAAGRKACCDPVATNIQQRCCQGTLLPYHEAIRRADDATRAEAALAKMTADRDALQAEQIGRAHV